MNLFLMALLMMVISSILAQLEAAASNLNSSCINKNKFMKILKLRNVTIYATPMPESSHCPGEWSVHGSCCSVSSLLEYAVADKQKIEIAKQKVFHFMAVHFHDLNINFKLARELESFAAQTDLEDWRMLVQTLNLPIFQALAEQAMNISSRQSFYSSYNRCYSLLAKLRANSLCSTCSGASQRFFLNKTKALISEKVCLAIMQSCSSSFRLTVVFLDKIDQLMDQLRDIPSIGSRSTMKEEIDKMDNIADLIRQTTLLQTFSDLSNQSITDQTKESKKAFVCQKMVSLSEVTHIEFLAAKLQISSAVLPMVKNMLTAMKEEMEYQSQIQGRLLQQSQFPSTSNWLSQNTGGYLGKNSEPQKQERKDSNISHELQIPKEISHPEQNSLPIESADESSDKIDGDVVVAPHVAASVSHTILSVIVTHSGESSQTAGKSSSSNTPSLNEINSESMDLTMSFP